MMMSEAEFRLLLHSLGKLLSPEDVQSLLFLAASEIRDKKALEECRDSPGNPLDFFTIMMERSAYTPEDPTLLLTHLKAIGNEGAVMKVQRSFGIDRPQHHQPTCQGNAGPVEYTAVARTDYSECNKDPSRKGKIQEPEANIFGKEASFTDGPATATNDPASWHPGDKRGQQTEGAVRVRPFPVMQPSRREFEISRGRASSQTSLTREEVEPLKSFSAVTNPVEDLELFKLSQHFHANKLYLLGLQLGISKGRISQIEHENSLCIAKAFFDILLDWKNRQGLHTNLRVELGERLCQIGCTDQARDFLSGNYI